MAAQVEPHDLHRNDESQENGAGEANCRQPVVERNADPERQAIRAEDCQQVNSRSTHHKAEQSAKAGARRPETRRAGLVWAKSFGFCLARTNGYDRDKNLALGPTIAGRTTKPDDLS